MIPDPEEEKLIRSYLLGGVTEEDRQWIEERLLADDDFIDYLSLVEDEIIDDYLFGTLARGERERFENRFLIPTERKRKLELAKRLIKYASHTRAEIAGKPTVGIILVGLIQKLFTPWWKTAAAGIVLLVAGFFVWQNFLHSSEIDNALAALNRAYRTRRPLQARITGFAYAEFKYSVERGEVTGEKELEIDYLALERARIWLFGAQKSGPELSHARGKYYLTLKDFDKAIDQLNMALASAPKDAKLYSDLGAAYLGRIEHDRFTTNGRKNEDVEQCLRNLNRALDLNPALLEALFNRALLYQGERLRREARQDWEKYRQMDPNSPWGYEASENLKAIENDLKKVSLRGERLYQDFIKATQTNNDEELLKVFSLSYSYNGNLIVDNLIDSYLTAKISGRSSEASEKLDLLAHIGKLSKRKTGDRFTTDLAAYYRRAKPKQLELAKFGREMMKEAYQLYQKSKNDQAVEKYERARQLFLEAGDGGEALFAEAWIGHCHHQRADVEKNLRVFTRLAPILKKKKYLWMEANAFCGLANGHNSSGRFSLAVDDSIRCGELSDRVGDRIGKIRSLFIRGGFYRHFGKHQESLLISQTGMDLSDQYSAEIRYAIAFYQFSSWSLSSLGLFESARAFQQEAIKMAEETKSPRLVARTHIHLGEIYGKWKKYDEAISSIQHGIAIGRELANDETGLEFVHYGLLYLGNVYREAGKFDQALKAFDEVIQFYRKSGRQIFLYAGSKGRLMTLIAQKSDAAAQLELDRVLRIYEKYRDSIREESNRNRFFDK
jgi:tetratricopeptide (TPR) repeat protein